MRAIYTPELTLKDYLVIDHDCWGRANGVNLQMVETPIAMQPTDAIRAQWKGRKHGVVTQARLAALHNGTVLGFRLEWADASVDERIVDNDQFVDAAAIMLPSVPKAPILLMGQKGAPVNAWYWRADEGVDGRNIVSEGYGTTRTVTPKTVICNQQWRKGTWSVVITRALALKTSEPIAQMKPAEQLPYGVAIWEGGNQERAGIKSFALSIEDLILDAAS
ncbi:putative steroid C25 dehydrogenase (S25dC4) [Steroidobacter denitrificans]|uniref:Putative steroid C25 dehydrogenase (S25dC4) n=1 Tax=Steroidobacter denitrificans TaxID=465721 RepID=A0A127FD62_STEDE|nr:ethylbenzene dehydrogenase-related protein [Steroidobacter denitrificans]AMN47555.1 putative steroid C25 dehydrogenase (S25dC4) [Steroidobacter denitrificans]